MNRRGFLARASAIVGVIAASCSPKMIGLAQAEPPKRPVRKRDLPVRSQFLELEDEINAGTYRVLGLKLTLSLRFDGRAICGTVDQIIDTTAALRIWRFQVLVSEYPVPDGSLDHVRRQIRYQAVRAIGAKRGERGDLYWDTNPIDSVSR